MKLSSPAVSVEEALTCYPLLAQGGRGKSRLPYYGNILSNSIKNTVLGDRGGIIFTDKLCREFEIIRTSVHSVDEAVRAEKLGACYVTAGNIFATDSKKGVPPRGLDFPKEVCGSVNIPVYAIGGINEDNMNSVLDAGADGACIMSGMMKL